MADFGWGNLRVSSRVPFDFLVHFEGRSPLATTSCKTVGVADHSPVGAERKRNAGMTSYLGAMWVESRSLETETQLLHKGRAYISISCTDLGQEPPNINSGFHEPYPVQHCPRYS